MFSKLLTWFLLMRYAASKEDGDDFIYNGFRGANMSLDGVAEITSDGLLLLTNSIQQKKGHAFYPIPLPFKTSQDDMYVGFSSSTKTVPSAYYILGWSFKMNGQAQALDLRHLPKLPRIGPKKKSKLLTIGLPVIVIFFTLTAILAVGLIVRRKIKFAEVLEDWEHEYGTHRFLYKDLFMATKGFTDKEVLGFGGFGRVYRGVLSASKIEVAVKRVSHESRQGMREFISEIVSLGRLRHRNLVRLLGYCRRKRELLLVYDFMPYGSLDKFLFDHPNSMLSWSKRFQIIKGVASGLLYLHEEWEQVVLHRDIKASNVLLDSEMNGRLGDFGLARLYDHGTDPQTTHMVGTFGYLAPELTKTGKATTSTDVFAFGAFMLEVACGRRPIDPQDEVTLVQWVSECWKRGTILAAADPKLGLDYDVEEMELVLKIGLLCLHQLPAERPNMRQVMQFLDRNAPLPELSSDSLGAAILAVGHYKRSDDLRLSYPSSLELGFASTSSIEGSVLSGGR
ncbi:L-type lectin-domain containing receptor kinase SIT2-like isoform X2 [Magnolia sinica]|uniref:L-type lectin-domain containing receptor kinase SIT2-like isoform X2 n=1 Tax=Magnolia sinica TaxID=86752 RepID=UPI00265B6012|nr:L-type lectin-domain containing receptor kinase SIT2-like isoform X2 [Magnolia sinica]